MEPIHPALILRMDGFFYLPQPKYLVIMDPNLFNVDGERLMQVLFMIVVLSFIVERALSILFESRFFIRKFEKRSLKELIAFITSATICWYWNFDAISILIVQEKTTVYGAIITGAVIAGGSKGSVKLFKELLGVKSKAAQAEEAANKVGLPTGQTTPRRHETVVNT